MKTIINEYKVHGRTFTIVHDGKRYMAVEDIYLDERGCTTQALNGFQTYSSDDLDTCINNVNMVTTFDHCVECGMTKAQAYCKAMGIQFHPEYEQTFARLFNW